MRLIPTSILLIFLSSLTFEQAVKTEVKFVEDKKINLEIASQSDSPILISGTYIDQLGDLRQILRYSWQNNSTKSIRSATVALSDRSGGHQSSTGFVVSVAPGKVAESGAYPEGADFSKGVKIKVDFVLFTDGTSWGEDINGESATNFGYETGLKDSVSIVREALRTGRTKDLATLLSKQLSDADIVSLTGNEDSKWRTGYRFGFNLTVSKLQIEEKQHGRTGMEKTLTELENSITHELLPIPSIKKSEPTFWLTFLYSK